MYIVSGSDQTELRYLCKELGIKQLFEGIYGSPTPKNDLVESVLRRKSYNRHECVLIGDSINDLNAARHNGVRFIGFNNAELERQSELELCWRCLGFERCYDKFQVVWRLFVAS